MIGYVLVALAIVAFAGGGITSVLPFLGGLVLMELVLVGAGRFSARARLDRRLYSLLGDAVDRLPADRRGAYRREWEAELHAILQGPPVARVWPAFRYVVGLRRAAPAIARVLGHRPRRVARGLREFGLVLVLIPVVTPPFIVLVALIGAGMVLVAAWALVVVAGRRVFGSARRPTYRETFVNGCRRSNLCLLGHPAPASDTPTDRTLLSL